MEETSMVSLERGQELHDRACRGERLNKRERTELDSWYAAMDAEEAQVLNRAGSGSPNEVELREQIRVSLERLQAITEETREIERGNEELRRQNEELKRVLERKGALVA